MSNNITLNTLAISILKYAQPKGISKVKFAKILYLTHKHLCKKGLASINDIKYIRMPLGPVPKGFMDLPSNSNVSVSIKKTNNDLAYNREEFSFKDLGLEIPSPKKEQEVEIGHIYSLLKNLSTSYLVGITHEEESWKSRTNGEEYFISEADLKRAYALRRGTQKAIQGELQEEQENLNIQSKLIKGMLDDLVTESTKLEYPELQAIK